MKNYNSLTAGKIDLSNIGKQIVNLTLITIAIAAAIYGSIWILRSLISEKPPKISKEYIQELYKDKSKLLNSVKMSLFGAAIGDAMGRPTEFIPSAEKIFQKYPGGVKGFEDFKSSDFMFKDGQKIAPYTDDTAMLIVVLDVLIKAQQQKWSIKKTMEEMSKEFVKDMERPNGWAADYRAPGNTCLKNCKKLKTIIGTNKQTGSWWKVSATGPYGDGGCGSVMRVAPLGLIFYDDLKRAEKWAVEHSHITHGADIALAACASMAVGVALAIQEKPYNQIVKEMIKIAKKYDSNTAKKIKDAYSSALETKNKILNQKKELNFDSTFEPSKEIFKKYLGWAADDAIASAVYCFTLFPYDTKNSIILGTNTPGDSDSIATLAGALSGAAQGSKENKFSLPVKWIEKIENLKVLNDLANKTYSLLRKK